MSSKRSKLNAQTLATLRQVTGRYASKFSAGGREKSATRRVPSLPKLNCLKDPKVKEDLHGPEITKLSDQRP